MQSILSIIREIESEIIVLKNTRNEASTKYQELLNVMNNHTRSSDYMIRFLKKPLVADTGVCDCKTCEKDLFQAMRISIEACDTLNKKLFPLPIPQ